MDRLDEELKMAMDTLESAVPAGYFDHLSSRIESRLEAVNMAGTDTDLDGNSTTSTTSTTSATDAPPLTADPATAPPTTTVPENMQSTLLVSEEEHSGLHDIKALAHSQKQRISKRMSTESDAEQSLLASASTSGLRAVALPDPTKEINRAPSKKAAGAKGASVSAKGSSLGAEGAEAVSTAADAAEHAAGGMPKWVYAGVAAVAAAAVIFFVVRGKGTKDPAPNQVAQAGASSATSAGALPGKAAAPAPIIAPITANSGADKPAVAAGPESGTPASDPSGITTPTTTPITTPITTGDNDTVGKPSTASASTATNAAKTAKTTSKPVKVAARDRRSSSASAKKPKPASRRSPAAKPKPKAAKPASTGKPKSMDDLLTSVTGVKKGGDAKPTGPAKPTKTSLTRGDIRSSMNRVKSRAVGCYAKHKQSGTVLVFVKVASSGKVRSVKPRGKWAGTPTGSCVASAVRGAKFPAWSGRPMSFPWPFLLSP